MTPPKLNTLILSRQAGIASAEPARVSGDSRPTFVLLHGWQSDLRAMEVLGDLLSASGTVHLIDLPGFGRSAMHDGTWGTPEYAACVLAYCREQGLSRVVIVGHSFGARLAIRLAHGHPALVSALVLIGAAGLQPVGWPRVRRGMKRFLNRFLKRKFASRDYLNAGNLRQTLVKTVSEDLAPLAAEVQAPALLLYGEQDDETPPSVGRRYHQLLKNSRFVGLEGKGHFPFAGTGAALCTCHILEFLSMRQADSTVTEGASC